MHDVWLILHTLSGKSRFETDSLSDESPPPVHSFREGSQEEKEGGEEIRHLDKQPGNCTRLLSFREAGLDKCNSF